MNCGKVIFDVVSKAWHLFMVEGQNYGQKRVLVAVVLVEEVDYTPRS